MKFNIGDKIYAIHYNYEYGTVQEIIGENFYEIVFDNGDHLQIEEKLLRHYEDKEKPVSSGSNASYYTLPKGATELMDLIEHKEMNCVISNIFKAAYRYGQKHHSSQRRDLEKIIYFANRELNRLPLD